MSVKTIHCHTICTNRIWDFDFIEKMELRLFSERPQIFKYAILMAVEISVLSVEITL